MASNADQIIADALRQTAARQSGGGDSGTTYQPMTGAEALQVAQKAFNAWLSDEANPISKNFDKVREKVEILDGSRTNQALNKAAVRFIDLRALFNFPIRAPNYRQLNTPPTADDYNALYRDVQAMYVALGTLAVIINQHGT